MVSIVLTVLDSHEVLRRQLLHFENEGLPDDTEIVLIDDGSDPPLEVGTNLPLTLHRTHDTRPWTWPVARNTGAALAIGDKLIMADLDHIITRSIIEAVHAFEGDFMRFNREFGVLDAEGNLTQDRDVLRAYGLPDKRIKDRGVKLNPHRNQFACSRAFYERMGGFREDRIGRPYPQREDGDFAKRFDALYAAGQVRDFDDLVGFDKRETIYMFPNGKYCEDVDHNPLGLFHSLSRKTKRNPYYHG